MHVERRPPGLRSQWQQIAVQSQRALTASVTRQQVSNKERERRILQLMMTGEDPDATRVRLRHVEQTLAFDV
jgi:hypothetical protein